MSDLTVLIGRGEQYGEPGDWRDLIAAGRLKADDQIRVRRGGALSYARAADVPELASMFAPEPAPPAVMEAAAPAPMQGQPAVPIVPAVASYGGEHPKAWPTLPAPERVSATSGTPWPPVFPSPPQPTKGRSWPWLLAGGVLVVAVLSVISAALRPSHSSLSSTEFAAGEAATPQDAGLQVTEAEPGRMLSWSAAENGGERSWLIDGLTLTLTSGPAVDGRAAPVLRISTPGIAPFTVTGAVGLPGGAAARFGVFKLDGASEGRQVLFTSFTGGAHCCTQLVVVSRSVGGWRAGSLGEWDGEPLPEGAQDLDGDGVDELQLPDQEFLYAFAPYADSYTPSRILGMAAGRVLDRSAAARFARVHQADLAASENPCRQGSNGACAAFAASAARLGRLDEAWPVVLGGYDGASDWTLPTRCLARRVDGLCPPGLEQTFASYPEALAWFLVETGYINAELAERLTASPIEPEPTPEAPPLPQTPAPPDPPAADPEPDPEQDGEPELEPQLP